MIGSVHLTVLHLDKTFSALENTAYRVTIYMENIPFSVLSLAYLFGQHFSSFLLVGTHVHLVLL